MVRGAPKRQRQSPAEREDATMPSFTSRATRAVASAPIHVYRWTLKPLIGLECRHLPTCSEYALEAIERNGAWRGSWQALARICRCHPWGSHGFDPVPDACHERHAFAPWRYGRWRVRASR
jgi:putative membrane protein insertion efficiency factor